MKAHHYKWLKWLPVRVVKICRPHIYLVKILGHYKIRFVNIEHILLLDLKDDDSLGESVHSDKSDRMATSFVARINSEPVVPEVSPEESENSNNAASDKCTD